jgi:hypothetical protein
MLAHLGQPDPKCVNNLSTPLQQASWATFLVGVFSVAGLRGLKSHLFLYNLPNRQNWPARNASGILQRHFTKYKFISQSPYS